MNSAAKLCCASLQNCCSHLGNAGKMLLSVSCRITCHIDKTTVNKIRMLKITV